MRLDVVFTPAGLGAVEVHGKAVFVIDVLRAGTTICAALSAGARAVVPTASVEEAIRLAQTLGPEETVLAGERNRLKVEGFALGNSPGEMTESEVRGKTLIMTTTNGTGALLAVSAAPQAYVAGIVNFSLVAACARAAFLDGRELLVVCAGREKAFALDDAYVAGRLIEAAMGGRRHRKGLNDGALAALDLVRRYGHGWERPLTLSQGGRDLVAAGFEGDITIAATEDRYPVLPVFAERRVVPAPAVSP
ncbi:MAG: 2-phosphosulfolactate phosphatase [Gemmatimonadota bacterium]|nr:2-phosphosulfolactate phosphatase [Gemmatimonadota bacterium]